MKELTEEEWSALEWLIDAHLDDLEGEFDDDEHVDENYSPGWASMMRGLALKVK
jgi:hypothetical protein